LIRRLILILFAVSANAQTHVTLDEAIHSALQTGTQAALARTGEERARIAENQGFQSLLPQADARLIQYNQSINLETFGFSIPGQPPVVGPFNVTDAQIVSAVQLFNLAALRQWQSLKQGVNASRFAVESAENDVAASVGRLYVIATRAQTQIASREADIALFQRLLEIANDEFHAGTGTRLDVAQAQVQLARARQALLVAQNDRRNAVLALLNAMGSDAGADVTLDPTLPVPAAAPAIDAVLPRARTQRPELRAEEARVRAAQLAYDAQRDRRVPSVALNFDGDYSGNHPDELKWTRRIAGTLSVPLFHADINAAVARAKADLIDAQINRDQRQRDVDVDVRRAVMNLENAQARVAVASENEKVAEEALTVARDRRAAGYGTPVEVDRAQDTYRQAREDLIAAQADAAAAELDLEHATGDIRARIGNGAPAASPAVPPAASPAPAPAAEPAAERPPGRRRSE
jgi:outer membrane protein TolC